MNVGPDDTNGDSALRRGSRRSCVASWFACVAVGVAGCTGSSDPAVEIADGSAVTQPEVSVVATLTDTSVAATLEPEIRYSDSSWSLRAMPRPHHRELWLFVEERDCAGGQTADDRTEVDVEETTESITLTVRVRSVQGIPTCEGHSLTTITVALEEAVGQRSVTTGRLSTTAIEGHVWDWAVPLQASGAGPLPEPATSIVVGLDAIVGNQCVNDDGSFADVAYWDGTAAAYESPARAVAAGVERFGLSFENWHQVIVARQFANDQIWSQYYRGAIIATIQVSPARIGWVASGSLCSLVPTGWEPDAEPGTLFRDDPTSNAPLIGVTDLLRSAGLDQVDEETWRFGDPDDRCPTWMQLQDAATDTGLGVDVRHFGAWPAQAAQPGGEASIDAELTVTEFGVGAVRLVTAGPHVHVEPIARDETGAGELTACQLDDSLTYEVHQS